jgi:hypothetical protein
MIGAGVGRIDGERLHGVDRLEDCSTFGQPLTAAREASRAWVGVGPLPRRPAANPGESFWR